MATKAFDYAFDNIDLIRKAVNSLRGFASNTAARRHAIRDLQILEAILDGVQELSPGSASEDTVRNLQYCSHFCQAPLYRCLQSLKELEPDICHAHIPGESPFETSQAPEWVTRLEGEVAVFQRSVGNGLQAVDLLLRVEAMRCDVTTNRTLPEGLQRMMETLQEWFRSPGKPHTGPGHRYHNIQTKDSAYSHNGDKYIYYFNGAPPSALVETFSKKLDETAGMLQIGRSKSNGGNSMVISLQGPAFTRVANAETSESSTTIPADVQPLFPQSAHLSATELAKLLLQCLLELLRTKINATLAMLLWTIPDFRAFVRSLSTFARQPSMLLDSNITLTDALNREVSLPYQWFRKWPHMLAHLQYEFKGTPGEYYVSSDLFDMFCESGGFKFNAAIPVEQWEDFVSPGIRIVMSMLLDSGGPGSHDRLFCGQIWENNQHRNKWVQCTHCGRFVLNMFDLPAEPASRRHTSRSRRSYISQAEQERTQYASRIDISRTLLHFSVFRNSHYDPSHQQNPDSQPASQPGVWTPDDEVAANNANASRA